MHGSWRTALPPLIAALTVGGYAGPNAQEQENWLLSGWERSKYDDGPQESLGVIVNIDRVVVVTGVSSGIGHGIAKALIAHQCHVFGRWGRKLPFLWCIGACKENGLAFTWQHAASYSASLGL